MFRWNTRAAVAVQSHQIAAILVPLAILSMGTEVFASHPGFAVCPIEVDPGPEGVPPAITTEVTLEVQKAHASRDVDTDVLFFTDRADIFGDVAIAGNAFDLPLIEGSDDPHWGDDGRFTTRTGDLRVTLAGCGNKVGRELVWLA